MEGRPIGSFGDICVFSFHPNKNITSIEGGALVVNDEREARDVEVLRFHGIARLPDGTRDVAVPGGKFNLPDVNAAVGLRQLARLPAFNARRRALVARYFERFRTDPPCELPHPGYPGDEPGTAGTCSRRSCRSRTSRSRARRSATRSRRAASAPACRTRPRISRPRTAASAIIAATFPTPSTSPTRTVTLPLFPTMTDADVDRVCAACAEVLAAHRR